MNHDKRELWLDLTSEERHARREATLLAGGRILRRKRWFRRCAQVSPVLAMCAAVLVMLNHKSPPPARQTPVAVAAPAQKPPAVAQSISDEELLALFPNTPVGLAKLENGKKRLIFPRPGDEERFVTRL